MAKSKFKNSSSSDIQLSSPRIKSKLIPSVTAVNPGQKNALREIANPLNHIVLLSGLAGSGKTFISASWGIEQLLKGKFERMIISRPYVESGEKLGYLPKGRSRTK